MKRMLLSLSLLALLCGCSSAPAEPTPLPAATPSPTPVPESPPPTGTPEPLWWDVSPEELPATPATAAEAVAGGEDFYLLAQLPEQDIALYGRGPGAEGCTGVLLRRGEVLTPFEQRYLPLSEPALPEVRWIDLDGDGGEELAVKYMLENHTGRHVFQLWVYEPQADGSWTACGLTEEEVDGLLAGQVDFRYDPASRTVTASLPRSSASLLLSGQDATPQDGYPLCFLDRVFYRYEDGQYTGVYGVGVLLKGAEAPRYFATVTARVVYDGAGFQLTDLSLTETGGV